MTTQPQPEALRQRLLDHAACHEAEHTLMGEDEQRQWAADLREAESLIGRLHAECEELRADAERWREFRTFVVGKSTPGFLNGKPAAYMVLPAITVPRVGMTLDESIDAARAAKEQSK